MARKREPLEGAGATPDPGQRLLQSKLKILQGASQRRTSLALEILTGRTPAPSEARATPPGPHTNGDAAAPADPWVPPVRQRPIPPPPAPAPEPPASPPPLARAPSRRTVVARTVYLAERDLRDIDFIIRAWRRRVHKRVSRSEVLRQAIGSLRDAVELGAAPGREGEIERRLNRMADLLSLIEEAREHALAGRFFDTANAARRILASHPSCLPALRAQAWAQLALNDDAAFETFQTCATLDPEDPLAEVGQGLWYDRKGLQERAVERLVRAWELEPMDQRIRKEVVRLGGEFPESALAEGIELLREGRNDQATGPLRHAAAANPSDAAAPLALATALWRLGGKQQAYNLATTVLAARPQCVKAILFVVAGEVASGRLLRTRELLVRAEQVDPQFMLSWPVVVEVGLEPVLDRHNASRQPTGYGR